MTAQKQHLATEEEEDQTSADQESLESSRSKSSDSIVHAPNRDRRHVEIDDYG